MTENLDPEIIAPTKKSKSISRWVIIGILIFLLFGLVVLYQNLLIINQKNIIRKLATVSPTLPPASPTISEELISRVDSNTSFFPKFYGTGIEGAARIEDPDTYDYSTIKNFILILTLDSEKVSNQSKSGWIAGKEYKYSIELNGIVDMVSEPLIAPNHKYGCVTLQSSGYRGSYVFELESGKGLDQGVQYSKCVEWIDQNKVIIWEHVYNSPEVTYYIFDVNSQKKTILNQYQHSN